VRLLDSATHLLDRELEVVLMPGAPIGAFREILTVRTDVVSLPQVVIPIIGEVVLPIEADPARLELGEVDSLSESSDFCVAVRAKEGVRLLDGTARCSRPHDTVCLETAGPGEWVLKLRIGPRGDPGLIAGTIIVDTSVYGASLEIPYEGFWSR